MNSQYSTLDNPIVVPVQRFAYQFVHDALLEPGWTALDVGFGLGYGLDILARKAAVWGVEVDPRAVAHVQREGRHSVCQYNGYLLPFNDGEFDLVTCIDVLEHVEPYHYLLSEMLRVTRHMVVISTPNRRPENTLPDGRPRNYWHLREWNLAELAAILNELPCSRDGYYINGRSPDFEMGDYGIDTQALMVVLRR